MTARQNRRQVLSCSVEISLSDFFKKIYSDQLKLKLFKKLIRVGLSDQNCSEKEVKLKKKCNYKVNKVRRIIDTHNYTESRISRMKKVKYLNVSIISPVKEFSNISMKHVF